MPLPDEYPSWLEQTVVAADAITPDLRRAGVRGEPVVLQWLQASVRVRILHQWSCRYDGDSTRHAELLDAADTWISDRRGVAVGQLARLASLEAVARDGTSPFVTRSLLGWYRDMMPTWLSAEPATRRQLLLVAHQWIVEHVLAQRTTGAPHETNVNRLGRELAHTIPPEEVSRWAPWIRLVQRDLGRALTWSADRRGEPWVRWLFLIPYSLPVPAAPSRRRRVRRTVLRPSAFRNGHASA